ncbi:DNA segregation ATPase FtsK/SpoIIIE, S-DNA-T family [Mesobacillus persicus]|uniref:DNA segregation ATPase FtsK/SpoIIIE, S-DNA-T family n=1 Tax=Mesobacillus persicus TaxID=930146 RepID=A0A1H7XZ15_9BACI|nr:DNA translocase FtsK [Mesobacillus persicus]SEM39060.1 DNA segregation ATPase FtsK/SpoIIIE, S-DNA-T family [Mesobacillus persicus]
MFTGEEEGERNEPNSIRKNINEGKQRPYPEPNQSEVKKDVDARVLYKYPKGQFKFPLIPDERVERRTETKTNTNTNTNKNTNKNTNMKNEKKTDWRYEETPVNEKKPDNEPVPLKPKVDPPTLPKVNVNRQPFRRTETPSPIFAFNRPKSDDAIEYELNGFIKDVSEVKSSIDIPEQKKVEITGEKPEQNPPLFSSEEVDTERLVIADETFEGYSNMGSDAEFNLISKSEQPPAIQEEELEKFAGIVEEETVEESVVMVKAEEKEEPIVSVEDTTNEGAAFKAEEPAAIIEEEIVGVPIAKSHEEEPSDIPVATIKEEERTEGPQLFFEHGTDEISSIKAEREAGMKEFFSTNEAINEKPLTVSDAASREKEMASHYPDVPVAAALEPTIAEPKKKQLPFNVLMLKQDKRKLEERKTWSGQKREKPSALVHSPKQSEIKNSDEQVTESVKEKDKEQATYQFPPLDLLQPPVIVEASEDWLFNQEQLLNETLKNFNVGARVVNVAQGPSVTRFEVQPEPGVKVNKITNLSDDIKLSLAAKDIRIEAPIPGKHTIGIEVPNETSRPVLLSEIVRTDGFSENPSALAVALGLDIAGTPVVTDLRKMPHGLIAGATGSGKSVCINTMLVSLLYKAHPDDVKLLLIDPKMVELAPYNNIPHLVSPVITDVKAATASLKWAVEEMERRYELFAHTGVRDINRFNELAIEHKRYAEKLPYIVIVIDELADLMMMSPADVEEAICRIAQKARACGIHLIIATQRPSVDVITGLIKANVPTRVAFSVSSQVDSRTIIDISGAEKLLGRGDMLFLENGSSKPFRLQGTFVSDREIDEIVAFVRNQRKPEFLFEQDELIKKSQVTEDEDELFYEACSFVIEQGGASTSSIQRRFKIGYNRAARLIDMMEDNGFISEGRGSKPRDVLISTEELDSFQDHQSLT